MFEKIIRSAKNIKNIFTSKEKSFLSPLYSELFELDDELPSPSQNSYDSYLKAYADSIWVFNCVHRIIQDISSVPIALYNEKDETIYEHPALDLLHKVNNQMTMSDLLEWTQGGLELTGNAYWKLEVNNSKGIPTMIWPLIPSYVKILKSDNPNEFIKGYEYLVNGKSIIFKPEEIIHFKNFNPLDYHYGLAPLAAARIGVETHNAGSKWNLNFLKNSARPDIAIVVPNALTQEQRNRMREIWNQQYKGNNNSHGVVFLERGAKTEILGVSQKDMDFVLQTKMSREDICAVFGVPPVMVGIFEYANYANSEVQEKIYWRSTILPKAEKICQILNEFYVPLFDKTGKIYFDIVESEIKALRADEEKRSNYINRYWQMGIPMDTLIDAYDLPFSKVKGITDVSYIPVSVYPSGSMPDNNNSVNFNYEKMMKEFDEGYKANITPSRAMLKSKHHRFIILANNLSKPMQKDVRKYFDEQRDKILKALSEYTGQRPNLMDIGISDREMDEELEKVITPHIRKSIYEGRDSENLLLKEWTKKDAPVMQEKSKSRIEDWIKLKCFQWAQNINNTTRKKLQKVLDEEIALGSGIEVISKRVAEVFDMERDYRTLRIAQTEVISSLNAGSIEAYRENEMVELKGWLPAYDEVTREAHAEAGHRYGIHGAIPIDEDFVLSTGATGQAPGDMSLAGDSINCRCTIFPVVKKNT